MNVQPMSGARFARYVGTDPERWASQFLLAYAQADAVRTDADRLALVTGWFADALAAAATRADTDALTAAIKREMAGGVP
jgi:hypothetical protein